MRSSRTRPPLGGLVGRGLSKREGQRRGTAVGCEWGRTDCRAAAAIRREGELRRRAPARQRVGQRRVFSAVQRQAQFAERELRVVGERDFQPARARGSA